MKNIAINTFIVTNLLFLLAACSAQSRIYTDSDPQQDFNQYQTFTWGNDDPMFVQSDYAVNPMVGKAVMQTIKSELETKGYRYVEDRTTADIAVIFSVGARDKVEYANQQNLFSENARWGSQFMDDSLMEQAQTKYVEGILAIDVFDIQKKSLVWHGFASKKLKNVEQEGGVKSIASSVEAILVKYPASSLGK